MLISCLNRIAAIYEIDVADMLGAMRRLDLAISPDATSIEAITRALICDPPTVTLCCLVDLRCESRRPLAGSPSMS